MPTYEYKCTVCDDRFDIEQRFSDDPLTSLEGCQVADDGAHRLKKIFSAIGISFKGDGFYRNDSRNGSASKPGAGPNSSEPDSSEPAAASSSSTDGGDANGSSGGSSNGDSSSSSTSSSTPSSNGDSKPAAAKSSSGD